MASVEGSGSHLTINAEKMGLWQRAAHYPPATNHHLPTSYHLPHLPPITHHPPNTHHSPSIAYHSPHTAHHSPLTTHGKVAFWPKGGKPALDLTGLKCDTKGSYWGSDAYLNKDNTK